LIFKSDFINKNNYEDPTRNRNYPTPE